MIENWKEIKGYENLYQVSNLGRIKALPKKRKGKSGVYVQMKGRLLTGGSNGKYRFVSLKKNGIGRNNYIHRLVAQHFILNPDSKLEVNHKDGNRLNNSALNLEWCTRKENHGHAISIGLLKINGENNPKAKLSNIQVNKIREIYNTGGFTQKNIALLYKISRQNVGAIINRKIWA